MADPAGDDAAVDVPDGSTGCADGEPGAGEGVAAQLRALRVEVGVLRDVVDDLLHPAGADPPPDGDDGDDGPIEPSHRSLEEWVTGYFTPTYSRPTSPTLRWCVQWWDHAEAISRLEALWRSFEVARLDGLRGMAMWYRDFLDSQLAVLTATTGPFAQCTPDRHAPTSPLPTAPAPAGYWTDDDTAAELPSDDTVSL